MPVKRARSSRHPTYPTLQRREDLSSARPDRDRDDSNIDITHSPHANSNSRTTSEHLQPSASASPHAPIASLQDPQDDDFGYLSGYLLPPGGPLVPDWDSNITLPDFSTSFFEPQGELALTYPPPPYPVLHEFAAPSAITAAPACQATPASALTSPANPVSLASAPIPERLDYSPTVDMSARSAMKRKAGTMSDASMVQTTTEAGPSGSKRPFLGRSESSRSASMRVPAVHGPKTLPMQPDDGKNPAAIDAPESTPSRATNKPLTEFSTSNAGRRIDEVTARLNPILPAQKVFPIRIGSELFQLSGASISSDAPSYFSHYFGEQLLQSGGKSNSVKTLYIDRDPLTFRDIALHLQGYHIKPRDGAHYVRLFADAQFYSLPRLTKQLFRSEIFVQVGERHFQISRDLFSAPGDSPNFFTLGFAHFFATPTEVFPGLEGQALLRPPSILPPAVPNRDGDIFAELVRILQGYDVEIRDEEHRKELLRDARYFHLKGVEQKLLPHEISYNLELQKSEIVMRIEDLRQSGIIFTPDVGSPATFHASDLSKPATPHSFIGAAADGNVSNGPVGWVSYQRPFVDETSHELIIEISDGEESTRLDPMSMRAVFYGDTRARVTGLFQVIANKMGLPASLPLGLMMIQSGGGVAAQPISPANSGVSGDRVRVRITRGSLIEVDGKEMEWVEEDEEDGEGEEDGDCLPSFQGVSDRVGVKDWIVTRSLWRLRVEESKETGKPEVIMVGVKVEALTNQRSRNSRRRFLLPSGSRA